MNPAIFNQPFIQVTLPLLLGMFMTGWAAISTNNKRFEDLNRRLDDLNRRFDETNRRLDSIDSLLREHSTRLTRLEERLTYVKG